MQTFRLLCGLLFALAHGLAAATAGTPSQSQVVIIGAGLSGLTAAYELKKAGIEYHVLELAPIIGGRVRTVRYEREGRPPVTADSGMEEYWQSNPAVDYIKELQLSAFEGEAASSVVIDGQLLALGDETSVQFLKRIFTKDEFAAWQKFQKTISPWIKELQGGKKISKKLLDLKEDSFASFVAGQNLPRKVAQWIRVSLECEIGTSWDAVSALDGIAEMHIFINGGEKFTRVSGGNARFVAALADAAGRSNISLNRRVTRVTSEGDRVQVYYLDTQANAHQVIRSSYVISTIPLYRLFQVQFEPPLSNQKQHAIDTLNWGSYFKAHVFVSPQAKTFWMQKEISLLPILSDSELGVIYEGNPGQEGPKIISLLVHGEHAETFNMLPGDQVRAQLKGAFEKLWPGFSSHITGIELYPYHPRAIAAWPPGRSRFDDLSDEIRRPENHVYLAGDFTESSHSDGAFISARRAVNQIAAHIKGKNHP